MTIKKKSVRFASEERPKDNSDDENVPLSSATKKVFAAQKKSGSSSILKKGKKGKMKNTNPVNPADNFDPASVLSNRTVNEKSKLIDMILYAIIKKSSSNSTGGASVATIKKYLTDIFAKPATPKTNKSINQELAKLLQTGKILNTSGLKGASGSFVINPDFENFDSRGIFAADILDPIEQIIEEVITQTCYDGIPYEKVKSKTEIKLEKAKVERMAKQKQSLYEKLKPMYELQLFSEVIKKPKTWNGTFFNTKVEQQTYFECICGSDLDAEDDKKYRVQCSGCTQYQHAECVRYDVSDPLRGDYFCPHCWALQVIFESEKDAQWYIMTHQ